MQLLMTHLNGTDVDLLKEDPPVRVLLQRWYMSAYRIDEHFPVRRMCETNELLNHVVGELILHLQTGLYAAENFKTLFLQFHLMSAKLYDDVIIIVTTTGHDV